MNNYLIADSNEKNTNFWRQYSGRQRCCQRQDLGKFDVITSDLPFGMSMSKNEDLEKLYRCFVEYCEEILNRGGKLVVYMSEHEMLEKIILKSKFKIIKTLELKFMTSVNAYLRPKIFVCRLKP